jgi:hypothetical protein
MRLPQELRDLIAQYAGTLRVAIAVCAAKGVRDAIGSQKRRKILEGLEMSMASDFARRNGMVFVPNLSDIEGDAQAELWECEGRIGGWSMLKKDKDGFINGSVADINLAWDYVHEHNDVHRDSVEKRFGRGWDKYGDAASDETYSCLETHIICILALMGYTTDARMRVTDTRMRVTGRRWMPSDVSPTKKNIKICPAVQ